MIGGLAYVNNDCRKAFEDYLLKTTGRKYAVYISYDTEQNCYRLKCISLVDSDVFRHGAGMFCVNWLPELKKKYSRLYDLFVQAFYLLDQRQYFLWDEQGQGYEVEYHRDLLLDDHDGYDPDFIKETKELVEYYESGDPATTLVEIRGQRLTEHEFDYNVKSFKWPHRKGMKPIRLFLDKIREFVMTTYSVNDLVVVNNDDWVDPSEMIFPQEFLTPMWSFRDQIFDGWEENMNERAGNFGQAALGVEQFFYSDPKLDTVVDEGAIEASRLFFQMHGLARNAIHSFESLLNQKYWADS